MSAARFAGWPAHRRGAGQECLIKLRDSYDGMPIKPGARQALEGRRLRLIGLWMMEADDPYPGEWALGDPGEGPQALREAGLLWIAEGDVIIEGAAP